MRSAITACSDFSGCPMNYPPATRTACPADRRNGWDCGRAMMLDPPLLLLDEPFSALDAITRESIYEEMLQLKDTGDRSVLLVTHDLNEAARLTDHLAILKEGRGHPAGQLSGHQDKPG